MFAPPDSLGGSADKINPDRLGVHRVWVRKNTAGHGPFSGLATCRHAALTAHGPGLAGASVLRSGRGTARHCNELPARIKIALRILPVRLSPTKGSCLQCARRGLRCRCIIVSSVALPSTVRQELDWRTVVSRNPCFVRNHPGNERSAA